MTRWLVTGALLGGLWGPLQAESLEENLWQHPPQSSGYGGPPEAGQLRQEIQSREDSWASHPFWKFMQKAAVVSHKGLRTKDLNYFLPILSNLLHLPEVPHTPWSQEQTSPRLSSAPSFLPLSWHLKARISAQNPKMSLQMKLAFGGPKEAHN
ncbi:MAG: hypothetical protein HY402_04760 [Elusimicrobia bacterium]|nr:hypothetical protein [Elusimicrobiota bacterium]